MNAKTTGNAPAAEKSGQAPARERLGVTPDEIAEMGRMGAMYYEHGNLEKARAIFEGLVELDPDSAPAHSALGALFTRTERFDEALRHLDRAVALDPRQIAPYVN
ncbi:MAG: tetratricopeptide repeat protein, partial [Pyrinomonadaceae bacterium]